MHTRHLSVIGTDAGAARLRYHRQEGPLHLWRGPSVYPYLTGTGLLTHPGQDFCSITQDVVVAEGTWGSSQSDAQVGAAAREPNSGKQERDARSMRACAQFGVVYHAFRTKSITHFG